MSDGVPITAGSGTTIATDDVSSVHYQQVKLVDGTLNSTAAIPGSATDGLLVNLGSNNDVVVSATNLDVRDLTATDVVTADPDKVSAATVTSVNDAATSTQLLASTAGRRGAYFFNDSTEALFIKFGTTASLTDFTVKVAAGGFYEVPTRPVYTGRIDGIWAANASGAVRITEL